MKYRIDHDLHIHSQLSSCSGDPEESPARILRYAEDNGFTTVCLTDHYWDETVPGASDWYAPQNTAHIEQALPLPQSDKVRFLFGCETDMDRFGTIGISEKMLQKLDFIIIPTTHLHMMGFTIDPKDDSPERRAALYAERLDRLLSMSLPFHKIGVAHLTCPLVFRREVYDKLSVLEVLDMIDDSTYRELYSRMAKLGAGFELNFNFSAYQGADVDRALRPYRIAKACGCKFYFGSDAHRPKNLDAAPANFRAIADALDLQEEDKCLLQ